MSAADKHRISWQAEGNLKIERFVFIMFTKRMTVRQAGSRGPYWRNLGDWRTAFVEEATADRHCNLRLQCRALWLDVQLVDGRKRIENSSRFSKFRVMWVFLVPEPRRQATLLSAPRRISCPPARRTGRPANFHLSCGCSNALALRTLQRDGQPLPTPAL